MSENQSNLYNEFSSVSLEQWKEKIEKDLKGKPISGLDFNPEFNLDAKAYYHPEEFKNQLYSNHKNILKNDNDWFITEKFNDLDSVKTNKIILDCLNKGTTGLKIELSTNSNISRLLSDVLTEHISIHIVLISNDQINELESYFKGKKCLNLIVEYPVFTSGIKNGIFSKEFLNLQKVIDSEFEAKTIVIDGLSFGNAGASTTQELGIILAQLNEVFESINVNNVHNKVVINLSINENYFVNISKFRALIELIAQLYEQKGIKDYQLPFINATTSVRNVAQNDKYNNVLRHTTEAMSAVLGGANAIVIEPYSNITNNDHELSERISRNIQLVLKEEAFFDKVVDPGSGSYYIEYLTDQIINKSWVCFMGIEKDGGYFESIKSNKIQKELAIHQSFLIDKLNTNSKTLLGVNKYPNSQENWIESSSMEGSSKGEFENISSFILENHFDKV